MSRGRRLAPAPENRKAPLSLSTSLSHLLGWVGTTIFSQAHSLGLRLALMPSLVCSNLLPPAFVFFGMIPSVQPEPSPSPLSASCSFLISSLALGISCFSICTFNPEIRCPNQ